MPKPKSSISLDINDYYEIIDILKCLNVFYDGDCDWNCDIYNTNTDLCDRGLRDKKMLKVIERMEKKVLLLKKS